MKRDKKNQFKVWKEFFSSSMARSPKNSLPLDDIIVQSRSSSHTQNHVHNLIIAVPFKRPNVITFQSFFFFSSTLKLFIFYLVWVDVDAMMKCRNLKCLKMFRHLRSGRGTLKYFFY
jgi:hypothetical protein